MVKHLVSFWYRAIAPNTSDSALDHQRNGIPLQYLLIVPFTLQIGIAVGLVGYLSLRNGQQAVNQVAAEVRDEITGRIQQHLTSYLSEPHRVNELNASAIALNQLDTTDLDQLQRWFWRQIQVFDSVSYIQFASADGSFVGAAQLEGGSEVEVEMLDRNTSSDLGLYATNDQGDRTTELGVTPDYDPRETIWYQRTIEAGETVWTPIYKYIGLPYVAITAGSPIYNTQGILQGIVATDLILTDINNFLRQLEVGNTGHTYIVERSGLLVATSTDENPYSFPSDETEEMNRVHVLDSQNSLTRASGEYLLNEYDRLGQIQTSQSQSFLLDGERQFIQVTPVQDEWGLDWLIVVVIPESDFMAQINANTRNTIWLCLLALTIAIILGIFGARRITRPIYRLNTSTQAIASGNLQETVKPSHILELARLGKSFNQMAQQLQQAFQALENSNHALEDRVAQRTAELEAANQEIQQLNQQLQADNVRMSTELDVAKQLQQMILPRPEELSDIPELEIAGFMEAADEVGGDYYDILRNRHNLRVSIGDVTGHGLESGVLMIMVQTAVRTLQALNEQDPVRSLSALNQVIYENTQRMKSDKNLSLSLLDYREGVLYISGQHEEAILVRSTGEVERIDTLDLGFPIGLVEDISTFIAQHQTVLNSGDVVVLYTDGITEAENNLRAFYGIDRLVNLVKQHGQCSADEIRSAVITDLRSHIGDHIIYDDITLVVLKRR
jgi:sigma-B regulation protein RsbU (phosphoserine phosphatase)